MAKVKNKSGSTISVATDDGYVTFAPGATVEVNADTARRLADLPDLQEVKAAKKAPAKKRTKRTED